MPHGRKVVTLYQSQHNKKRINVSAKCNFSLNESVYSHSNYRKQYVIQQSGYNVESAMSHIVRFFVLRQNITMPDIIEQN